LYQLSAHSSIRSGALQCTVYESNEGIIIHNMHRTLKNLSISPPAHTDVIRRRLRIAERRHRRKSSQARRQEFVLLPSSDEQGDEDDDDDGGD